MGKQVSIDEGSPAHWKHLPFGDPEFMRWWLESHTHLSHGLRAQIAHEMYNAVQVEPVQAEVSAYLASLGYEVVPSPSSIGEVDDPTSAASLLEDFRGRDWKYVVVNSIKRVYETRPALIYLLVVVTGWSLWSAFIRLRDLF